jgi:hypothetical protein
LTNTDPNGRIDGVRARARRAKKRGVVHDCGYEEWFAGYF